MTDQDLLTEWNRLADKLRELFERCGSAPRAHETTEAACDVCISVDGLAANMTWASADPRFDMPDEAGEQVRILREQVERLAAALNRDPTFRGPRSLSHIEAPDLRLPGTVAEVRAAHVREMAAMLLHQRLVHGVILDSCGPDEDEWEAMTNVVNALPPRWRGMIESISNDFSDPSYSVVLGRCRRREAMLIGQALRQLFAEYRPGCGGVILSGPDLADEIEFSLRWDGNCDWAAT